MKTKLLSLIALAVIITPVFVSTSALVLAQATPVPTTQTQTEIITIPNPLKATSVADLIDRITTFLIEAATVIFPLVVVYAAFQLMSAGGNTEKAILGRKTLTYAVLGYVLILMAKGLTLVISNFLK